MQELCKIDLGWDQALDGELLAEWQAIIDAVMKGPPIVLPRCYLRMGHRSTHSTGFATRPQPHMLPLST